MVVLGGRLSHGRILGQDNDTVVGVAHTDLVLCADHTERLHAAQLRPLDGEALVSVVEDAAQVGHDHLLALGHIGCATDDLLRSLLAQIHRRDMEVVAIGMGDTRQHFTYRQTLQPTRDGLYFVQSAHFETRGGQCLCHLLRCQVEIDVLFQPFV